MEPTARLAPPAVGGREGGKIPGGESGRGRTRRGPGVGRRGAVGYGRSGAAPLRSGPFQRPRERREQDSQFWKVLQERTPYGEHSAGAGEPRGHSRAEKGEGETASPSVGSEQGPRLPGWGRGAAGRRRGEEPCASPRESRWDRPPGEAARGPGRSTEGGGVPAQAPARKLSQEHRLQPRLALHQAQSREDAADLAPGVRWFLAAERDEPPRGSSILRPQHVTLGPAQLGKIP